MKPSFGKKERGRIEDRGKMIKGNYFLFAFAFTLQVWFGQKEPRYWNKAVIRASALIYSPTVWMDRWEPDAFSCMRSRKKRTWNFSEGLLVLCWTLKPNPGWVGWLWELMQMRSWSCSHLVSHAGEKLGPSEVWGSEGPRAAALVQLD